MLTLSFNSGMSLSGLKVLLERPKREAIVVKDLVLDLYLGSSVLGIS
jgi:hypothetical protein